jgi:hypothetical protein
MIKLKSLLTEFQGENLKVGDFVLTTGKGPLTGPNSPLGFDNLPAIIVGKRQNKYLIMFRGSISPLEATDEQIIKVSKPHRFPLSPWVKKYLGK